MQKIIDRIEFLREEIRKNSKLYYENDAPAISDYEYDMMFAELKGLEEKYPELYDPASPTLRVGGRALDRFEKVYRMLIEDTKKALPSTKIIINEPFVLKGSATEEHFEEFLEVYKYAEVTNRLKALGIRAELDDRNEKLGYRIREAQLSKIPYMCVVGDNEMKDGTVTVRARKEGEGGLFSVDDFIAKLAEEIKTKAR